MRSESLKKAQKKYRSKPEVNARITERRRLKYTETEKAKKKIYYLKNRNYKSDNFSDALWRIYLEN